MNTFIGSLFCRNFSLAHFAANGKKIVSPVRMLLVFVTTQWMGNWWSDNCHQQSLCCAVVSMSKLFFWVSLKTRGKTSSNRNSLWIYSRGTFTARRKTENHNEHTLACIAFNCIELFITTCPSNPSRFGLSGHYKCDVIMPTVSLSANLMN